MAEKAEELAIRKYRGESTVFIYGENRKEIYTAAASESDRKGGTSPALPAALYFMRHDSGKG